MSAPTVQCAVCAAGVVAEPGRAVVCSSCDTPLVVVSDHPCPEAGILPGLDAAAAKASFARLLHNDGEPRPGPYELHAELLFAPFYRLTGVMAGVSPSGRAVHRWADAYIAGADDHDELGLDQIDAARAADRIAPGSGLAEVEAAGTVLHVERDRDEVEAFLAEQARIPADGDEPALVDRQLMLLDYPFWRLRFVYHGLQYQATVDGLTGTVLAARIPAKQRRRAFLGVFATACFGYVLGTMLRHPGMGVPGLTRAIEGAGAGALLPTLALVGVGGGLYVLLLNAAWNGLRYRNELVYASGLKTRVLINRPAETWLDRATAGIKRLYERVVSPRRFDR